MFLHLLELDVCMNITIYYAVPSPRMMRMMTKFGERVSSVT